ncbi:unnamed protein product [uncultured archaeal virus]|uniref:Nucleotidyltransferase n=1 Tax=uncultured archaeal virus TaxID=1960247 RepID=A0ABM9HVJ0_9VIRU|nr:unnamed protein product [uncultured archaeal virus]CAI3524013.1 unnamed protein product [uncultured archaeal virus]CAI4043394.1 unnamed protein product [uncultured archaeal virus]
MSNVLPDFDHMGYLPPANDLYCPDINEFITRFVEVDGSSKRKKIFEGYQSYCTRFRSIIIKLWVDGSYITDKLNPNDIDLTVHYDAIKFNDLRIIQFVEKGYFANRKYLKAKYECDTFPVPVYPKNHPFYQLTVAQSEKWRKWFTKDRNGIPKGLVELLL